MELYVSWNKIKELVNTRKLPLQYCDKGDTYIIFVSDLGVEYSHVIRKTFISGLDAIRNDSEKLDFETNYKLDANKSTVGDNGIACINNLAEKYSPRFYMSSEVRNLDSISYSEIVNLNFTGKLKGISLNFDHKKINIIVKVDNIEILNLVLEDLEDAGKYYLLEAFPAIIKGNSFRLNFEDLNDVLQNLIILVKSADANIHKLRGVTVCYGVKL